MAERKRLVELGWRFNRDEPLGPEPLDPEEEIVPVSDYVARAIGVELPYR